MNYWLNKNEKINNLSRNTKKKVFHVNVSKLPQHEVEAFIEKMKDQFRQVTSKQKEMNELTLFFSTL